MTTTPTPTLTTAIAEAPNAVDVGTLWVAGLTLLATVVFAVIDFFLRRSLGQRADFHTRYVIASQKALSKRGSEQRQGVRELKSLVKSRWASAEDKQLALLVVTDLDGG